MEIKCETKGCNGECLTNIISMACEVLENGGLIVYPTDTLYGIGGDAMDPETYRKIDRVKCTSEKNVSIAYTSLEQALEYVELPSRAVKLADKFLPGPLTIVVETKDGTAGIRIPNHPFVKGITEQFGPITSTSANIHGEPPAKDIEDAKMQLGDSIDLYISCNIPRYEKGSTVVKVNEEITILREGMIDIGEILGE